MSVLSDASAWWDRAERRREFCAPDTPWVMVKEVGRPVHYADTFVSGDDDFERGARECSAYLLAIGLAPDAVFGIGARALWPDDPGRFSVVHIAVPEVVERARNYAGTSPAPLDAPIVLGLVTGLPMSIIRRGRGQAPSTVGEAIAVAIAFARIAPQRCFGAFQRSVPALVLANDKNVMDLGAGGVAITTPRGAPWAPQFARGVPYRLDPGTVVQSPSGPVELIRLGWRVFAERARRGDLSVPSSPLEVGVAFLETVGVRPRDCWGVFEVGAVGGAYVQIIYRKAPGDDEGRSRFARYLRAIGVAPSDLVVRLPDGKIAGPRTSPRIPRR